MEHSDIEEANLVWIAEIRGTFPSEQGIEPERRITKSVSLSRQLLKSFLNNSHRVAHHSELL